ncbi:hypothetical protein C8Q80DRAFT_554579 [Daedaleopsis nitida]|nr:hypothetical protein C8Q80DRAFT_554579 [Daedaleopsis nitida]
MVDVEAIPTELWREIISLACTDGGFTGKSPALTSKFIHQQSLSPRFHSVAVQSLQHLQQFLSLLDKQSERHLVISHLYMSFLEEPCRTPSDFWRTYAKMSRLEKAEHDRKAKEEKRAWDELFVAAMTKLFALVAPTLRTLCIVGDWAVRFPTFSCDTLPCLEELTVRADLPSIFPSGAIEDEARFLPPNRCYKLPALRRLHVVCLSRTLHCAKIVNYLNQHTRPCFTHLRLSNIDEDKEDRILPHGLARSLGVPHREGDTPVATKLSGVRHVVIHGYPPAPGGWCGFNDSIWDTICWELEALAERCEFEKGLRFLVMSRPWRRNPRWGDRLYDDWVDRIEGKDGCWVESEEAEEQLEVYEDDHPPPGEEQEFGLFD